MKCEALLNFRSPNQQRFKGDHGAGVDSSWSLLFCRSRRRNRGRNYEQI